MVFSFSRSGGTEAASPSGWAKVCKTFYGGSIPPVASNIAAPDRAPDGSVHAEPFSVINAPVGPPLPWLTAESSLAALARRTGAAWSGRPHAALFDLLAAAGLTFPPSLEAFPHQAVRWELPDGAASALLLFSARPLNGPQAFGLLAAVRYPQPCTTDPLLYLGPVRWEGPLEARLIPAHYHRLDRDFPALAPGTRLLGPGAPPALFDWPAGLLMAFAACNGHLLHRGPAGAWALLPDLRQAAARDRVWRLLEQLRAPALSLAASRTVPAATIAPIPPLHA